MAELGGSVDELELDLLQGITGRLGQQCAAQGDGALDSTGDGSLQGQAVQCQCPRQPATQSCNMHYTMVHEHRGNECPED